MTKPETDDRAWTPTVKVHKPGEMVSIGGNLACIAIEPEDGFDLTIPRSLILRAEDAIVEYGRMTFPPSDDREEGIFNWIEVRDASGVVVVSSRFAEPINAREGVSFSLKN